MRRLTTALALFALAASVPAQAGTAQAAAADADLAKLLTEWRAEQAKHRTALKALQATDDYKAAVAAKDTAKQRELRATLKAPDAKAFGERALHLADQFGDDGVRFLAAAAANFSSKDVAQGIADRVAKRHAKNPGLRALLEQPLAALSQLGVGPADDLLQQIIHENPDDQAVAYAHYWRSILLGRGKPSDEQQAEAAAALAAAEKLAKGDLADRIAAPKFEREQLQIGKQAPDIVGEDMDGVPFKLSDYRGKVVVLDFWGFW